MCESWCRVPQNIVKSATFVSASVFSTSSSISQLEEEVEELKKI